MLGLYHSRIIVDIPFIEKKIGDELRPTTKLEKYENQRKSNYQGERVLQTISIIENYAIYSQETTQASKEFLKKSKSFAKISNPYPNKEQPFKKTIRKFSNNIENSFINEVDKNNQSNGIKLIDSRNNTNLNCLLNKIIYERKRAAQIISSAWKTFLFSLKVKKKIISEQIDIQRGKNSISIQKNVRRFLVRKHINILKNRFDLIFFYDYKDSHKVVKTNNEKKYITNLNNNNSDNINSKTVKNEHLEYFPQKDIKIRIIKDKGDPVEVKLHYTKILHLYYLPFNKKGVMRKRFKVNFIVDGKIVVDPRFEVDNDEHGNFFNIIESSSFKKRNFQPNIVEFNKPSQKFWENIFEIKSNFSKENSSISDMSEQHDTTIEKLMCKHSNYLKRQKSFSECHPQKSILRNSSSYDKNKFNLCAPDKLIHKRVSFNDKVEYSS